jgi:hypothetical protein
MRTVPLQRTICEDSAWPRKNVKLGLEGDTPPERSDTDSALTYALWACALLFAGVRIIGISNLYFHLYDEGAYYYGAVLAAGGQVPYADFFYAQPPGLLAASVCVIRAGFGLAELRILHGLVGILLPVGGAFLTAQFVPDRRSPAPPLAALLIALSELFQYHSRHVLPDTPVVTLMLFSAGCFFRRGYWSPCYSAALLAAALFFKLQAAVVVPWLIVSSIVFFGWRDGSRRLIRFLITLALLAGVAFAVLAVSIPQSLDCLIGFQARRPRLPLVERSRLARKELLSLDLGLGLLTSALHLVRRDRAGRCIGLATLIVAAGITLGANSLYTYYYFYLVPFAAVSTAVMLILIARSGLVVSPRTAVVAASGLLIALHAPTVVARASEARRLRSWVSQYKQLLADLPGDRILTTDPGVFILSGKQPVPDYFASDPGAALLAGQFDPWIARTIDRADVVLITDRLLFYIGRDGVDAIRKSRKPLRFGSTEIDDSGGAILSGDNRTRWRELAESTEAGK